MSEEEGLELFIHLLLEKKKDTGCSKMQCSFSQITATHPQHVGEPINLSRTENFGEKNTFFPKHPVERWNEAPRI